MFKHKLKTKCPQHCFTKYAPGPQNCPLKCHNFCGLFNRLRCRSTNMTKFFQLWKLQLHGIMWIGPRCLRRDCMETTQHYIKIATQLYLKRNKTHIRHHSSASTDITGHAFVYYFNKKVFYLTMLPAIKSVASVTDERNMSLGHWWNYTEGGSFPVPLSPPQNPHRLAGDRTRTIFLVVGCISKRRWSPGILAMIREWQIGKALK